MGTYKYSAEFRADAVALHRAGPGRSVAAVAKDLGVNHETLHLWINAAEESETPSVRVEVDKDAEIAALRRQVHELELEREILRRAAKYFACETSW
ncbi:transposase [Streptomyces scabiei]|uniref:transposase n=1 Tax=Streptomyces scabiei TaxID=1930 RepID=UPI000765AE51|nr:transposase [Streptomyces scabiei]